MPATQRQRWASFKLLCAQFAWRFGFHSVQLGAAESSLACGFESGEGAGFGRFVHGMIAQVLLAISRVL
jgi:hypothetical protein